MADAETGTTVSPSVVTTTKVVVDPRADSAGNIPADKALTKTFLDLSGYKDSDVVGSNLSRRSFVTGTGGKYVVSKSGKAIRVLSGPVTPKMAEAAEEADDE